MKRLFSFLMVTVLVVSMLTATAFAADTPTATITVTGLEGEVETGDQVKVTITVTSDDDTLIGGVTLIVNATGLKFISGTGYAGESKCTEGGADSEAQKSFSWTYTYEVTAAAGEKASVSVSSETVNGIGKEGYKSFTVKEASATATVKAAETEPKPETVDKTELNKEIAKAEAIDETEYTAESIAALKTALDAAEKVAADTAATQDDVDDAVEALEAALDALVEKATEPSTKPTQPTQPSGPDLDRPSGWQPGQSLVPSGTTAPTTTPEKDEVPKTADATTQVWPLAVMMVLSAAGVAVLVRKRNGK